jgi:hypothetical protein
VNRTLLKWAATILGLVIIGTAIAVVISTIYLNGQRERWRREVAEIRLADALYERPVVFGDSLNQNAAVWYRQALPRFKGWQRQKGVTGGLEAEADSAGNPRSGGATRERCTEAGLERVENALRSTRCDWELGMSMKDEFPDSIEGFRLAACLSLDGNEAASSGDHFAAARSYIEAIAVGCDLGRGTFDMCMTGTSSARVGLVGLGHLVALVNDRESLDSIANELSQVEGRLPDLRAATRRERLWIENALTLDQMTDHPDRSGNQPVVVPYRALSALLLWRDRAFLKEFGQLASVSTRDQALAIGQRLPGIGHSELAGTFIREAVVVTNTFDLFEVYRAVQLAVDLQRWHIDHAGYPADKSEIDASIATAGVRYELTQFGKGYRLSGTRGVILETPPR